MQRAPFDVELPRSQSALKSNWLNRLESVATNQTMVLIWLAAIILIGAALRFTGLNWDENQHLHPDERFLTMLETAIRWPDSLGQYFDTAVSPLSPYNNNFTFYVYGTLPLWLVKRVGMFLNQNGYDQIFLVGRALSAIFDLGSIVLLFMVGRRLYGNKAALLGAAFLSLTVLDIQQSHFFTMDTYANLFVVATFYLAVRGSEEGHWWDYALMGMALGAGVASKINVANLGVVAALAGGLDMYRVYQRREGDVYKAIEHTIARLALAAALSLLTFRVLQPIAFQGPNILNFNLNPKWLANMTEVAGLMSGAREQPPGYQWIDRPALWFPWANMVGWGMGPALGLAAWAGWAVAAWELVRRRKLNHLLPVAFVAVVFLQQGVQYVKSLRYFLSIYPFLALLAGYLIVWLWRQAKGRGGLGDASQGETSGEAKRVEEVGRPHSSDKTQSGWSRWRVASVALAVVVLVCTFLYAVAFTSIYTRESSRVQASRWIYATIPKGAVLANEHWDDPLPLRVDGKDGFGGWYKGLMLNNYDDDSLTKLNQMVDTLARADYVILSSNRLYDSIPRLPWRYPMTIRYYQLLFGGKLGFEKVAEFTSYPQIFGIQFPDQGAEEAFSVYDHPKVTIYKRTAAFDREEVRRLLSDGIDWTRIRHDRPK